MPRLRRFLPSSHGPGRARTPRGRALLLVRLCLVAAAVLPGLRCSSGAIEFPPAPSVLDRVAVVGASASAGFGIRVDGRLCDLARVLDRCIARPHEAPRSLANSMMFLTPDEIAGRQLRLARQEQPRLVLGLDLLFWFGYGVLEPGETRSKRLERGLALVDGLECPVLISTLPDMSAAIGTMLLASQVPSLAELERLNARIREYAASRDEVHLLELPALLDELGGRGRVKLRDGPWPPDSRPLLQDDHLHPTLPGLVAVCLRILWQLEQEGLIDARDVHWNPDEVLASIGAED